MSVQYVKESYYYEIGTPEDKQKIVHLRENLARAHRRDNARNITISLDSLFEIGEKQNWRDCFTGEPLEFTRGGNWGLRNSIGTGACNPYSCSIDRIDSNIDYHDGNIQLVTSRTNLTKGNMSNEEFVSYCKSVAEYSESK